MSFRYIPFKSALIEERDDTEYEGEINGHGEGRSTNRIPIRV